MCAEYGLRLASHIFVKDISPESLAARDGNIQEGRRPEGMRSGVWNGSEMVSEENWIIMSERY